MNNEDIMHHSIRVAVIISMVMLTFVSMWTTYVSVKDSILPEPLITLPIVGTFSFLALFLALGIGLILLALKLAILDERKHLNVFGLAGLIVISFISIAFNMDVLYRTADQQFFLNYSNNRVREVYEPYLGQIQKELLQRKETLLKALANQTTEVSAEVEGLRTKPAGYGPLAKEETYKLKVLEANVQVEITAIEEALTIKKNADEILAKTEVNTLKDIEELQNKIRSVIKDAGAVAGFPLPPPVHLESPFFAVFNQLFTWKSVGLKEIFFLAIAVFLDLGDIVGYKLVPNNKKRPKKSTAAAPPPERKTPIERLALPGGAGDRVLMDSVTMHQKFQAYCKSCGFQWNAKKKYFKRNDGTTIREATNGSFGWELVKGDRILPIWIASVPINNPHGVEIPAQVWNQAKAGNAILLEPQNNEFVEMQCETIRQEVEAGRLRSTAIYRIKMTPPTTVAS